MAQLLERLAGFKPAAIVVDTWYPPTPAGSCTPDPTEALVNAVRNVAESIPVVIARDSNNDKEIEDKIACVGEKVHLGKGEEVLAPPND